jgi:THO complex subunit 3
MTFLYVDQISYPNALSLSLKTKEFRGHRKFVHSLRWNCDGSKLASGSVDTTVRIWVINLENGVVITSQELRGHSDNVSQLCWHPNNPSILATASSDKTVRIWNDGKQIRCIITSGMNINIAFSSDGKYIGVGNKEDLISIIDYESGSIIKSVRYNMEINELAWDKSSSYLFLTTGQGSVIILKFPSMEHVYTINAHTSNCYCIEFNSDGKLFAIGSADTVVSLWSTQELLCIRTFSSMDWPVRAISFNHDGTLIASASEEHVIDISNVHTGNSVLKLPCFSAINTCSFHPHRNLLAFAGDEVGRDEGNIR